MEDLQRRLKAAGYDPGEVDGEYGPNTEAAVRALQKDAGILVDGEFGPDSYAALLALEVEEDVPEAEDKPATGNRGQARDWQRPHLRRRRLHPHRPGHAVRQGGRGEERRQAHPCQRGRVGARTHRRPHPLGQRQVREGGERMSDVVVVALITGAVSLLGSAANMVVSAKKAKQQADVTLYRIGQLEAKVSKHNNLMERTYKLEGRMTEAEHDIRDMKGRERG